MRFFESIVDTALNASRPIKRIILVAFDSLVIFLMLSFAIASRLECLSFCCRLLHSLPHHTLSNHLYLLKSGLYRAFLRHVSTEVAVIIAFGSVISAGIVLGAITVFLTLPLSTAVIYAAFLFIATAGTGLLCVVSRTVIGATVKI